MNHNHQYVPNYEKWIKFYESVGTSEHPIYFHSGKISDKKINGTINKIEQNRIIPIETRDQKCTDKTPGLKVEFVSPAQQIVEQATSEIKREKGIKRKYTPTKNQSHKSTPRDKKKKKRKNTRVKGEYVGNQF